MIWTVTSKAFSEPRCLGVVSPHVKFDSQWVLQWRLFIVEYGPTLCYIKGSYNLFLAQLAYGWWRSKMKRNIQSPLHGPLFTWRWRQVGTISSFNSAQVMLVGSTTLVVFPRYCLCSFLLSRSYFALLLFTENACLSYYSKRISILVQTPELFRKRHTIIIGPSKRTTSSLFLINCGIRWGYCSSSSLKTCHYCHHFSHSFFAYRLVQHFQSLWTTTRIYESKLSTSFGMLSPKKIAVLVL